MFFPSYFFLASANFLPLFFMHLMIEKRHMEFYNERKKTSTVFLDTKYDQISFHRVFSSSLLLKTIALRFPFVVRDTIIYLSAWWWRSTSDAGNFPLMMIFFSSLSLSVDKLIRITLWKIYTFFVGMNSRFRFDEMTIHHWIMDIRSNRHRMPFLMMCFTEMFIYTYYNLVPIRNRIENWKWWRYFGKIVKWMFVQEGNGKKDYRFAWMRMHVNERQRFHFSWKKKNEKQTKFPYIYWYTFAMSFYEWRENVPSFWIECELWIFSIPFDWICIRRWIRTLKALYQKILTIWKSLTHCSSLSLYLSFLVLFSRKLTFVWLFAHFTFAIECCTRWQCTRCNECSSLKKHHHNE